MRLRMHHCFAITAVLLMSGTRRPPPPASQAPAPPTISLRDTTLYEPDDVNARAAVTVTVAEAPPRSTIAMVYSTIPAPGSNPPLEGTACTSGVDYIAQKSQSFTFSSFQVRNEILISICPDRTHEPNETFIVHLIRSADGVAIGDGEARVTIVDNDPPPPLWSGMVESGTIARGEERRWETPLLPPGNYKFELTGNGDADLFVRMSNPPTQTTYDCRPLKAGSNESCLVSHSHIGGIVVHIMVRGHAPSSNFQLRGMRI